MAEKLSEAARAEARAMLIVGCAKPKMEYIGGGFREPDEGVSEGVPGVS